MILIDINMGRPAAPLDIDHLVGMYRAGLSLRTIAASCGVSRTTIASRLQAAGELRRGTQEGNQIRYPRAARTCRVCGQAFGVRQGFLRLGVLGEYCSRPCWWKDRPNRSSTVEVRFR